METISPAQQVTGVGTSTPGQQETVMGTTTPEQQVTGVGTSTPGQQETVMGTTTPEQQVTGVGTSTPGQQETVMGTTTPEQQVTGVGTSTPGQQETVMGTTTPEQQVTGVGTSTPGQQETVMGTSKPEEQETGMETSPENEIQCLDNQHPGSDHNFLNNDVKVYIFRSGITKDVDKEFADKLRKQIPNLRRVGTVEECNIILVFCPVVSRTGTNIDDALKQFDNKTDSKLGVLVVLHHTFDPEKTVLDSSRCVTRTDILTVDCLFYEDTGLLKCQKNSDAIDKVLNLLMDQGWKTDIKISPHRKCFTEPGQIQGQGRVRSHKSNKNKGESQHLETKVKKVEKSDESGKCLTKEFSLKKKSVKVFSILAGKTNDCDKECIATLGKRIENLREVATWEESDIILVFCPIVSRAVTDIEAALNKLNYSTDSKLGVLVVLHHTFDPEKTVLDSSRCVTRTDILTVDCLFYEDTGLLECQKNSDAFDKVVNWLTEQGKKRGIEIYQRTKAEKSRWHLWNSLFGK